MTVQGRLGLHGTAIPMPNSLFKWRTENVKGKPTPILETLLEITFPCILRLRPGMRFVAYDGEHRVEVSSVRIERDTS